MMAKQKRSKLGVNIDHVATLRRLRDTSYPSLVDAARECIAGGADQITVHLREDRRHIVDQDLWNLAPVLKELGIALNLEMAATREMLDISLRLKPNSICLVPEKREERTTEGGLSLGDKARNEFLKEISSRSKDTGILVSFFIEPDSGDVETSKTLGADAVELHTGSLCLAIQKQTKNIEMEWGRLRAALVTGTKHGLLMHAGHGIDYEIAPKLGALPFVEFNIGHSIICESVFVGLREATRKMRGLLS